MTPSAPVRRPILSRFRGPPFAQRYPVTIGDIVMGGVLGIAVLHPVTMVLYWFEFHPVSPMTPTFWAFARFRLLTAFTAGMLGMNLVFASLGGLTAAILAGRHRTAARDRYRGWLLARELERGLELSLAQGETEDREFKATLRWDPRLKRVNSALEQAVIKTIAGFMNTGGGTLFIGVGDEGSIKGLEDDFRTLKRPNRDGYEAFLMALVDRNLGPAACPFVHVMFHDIQGRTICHIVIEPTPFPVFTRTGEAVRFYIRAGNSTRSMDIREATAYIQVNWPGGKRW